MKKAFLIFLLCLIPLIGFAQQERQMPVAPDVEDQAVWFPFDGQWMPAVDASLIGPKNYKTLKNMRYIDGGLEGVAGYTKINTTTALTTYLKGRSGFHFKKDQPAESHVLVQEYNTGLTASQVLRNSTAIPSQGDFNATALHTDATGAGLGRFAQGPQGTVIYNNGVESMIWGGNESPIGAFITSTAAINNTLTNPRDYTEQVRNTLDDSKNIATVGGGNDANTVLLLHADGAEPSTTFTDSSTSAHTATAEGDAQIDTAQKKFGTASGLFDGTGDYLSVPDDHGVSDHWEMGTGKFTIDFWVRVSASQGSNGIVEQYVDDDNIVQIRSQNNYISFRIISGGVTTVTMTSSTRPFLDNHNEWIHIAVIRGWGGAANGWAITQNGVAVATLTDADSWPDLDAPLEIGRTQYGVGETYYSGWIDELRVSKGVARWASTFTPLSYAYGTPALYWVVGSTRALQGVKYYVENGNGETGTLTASEWNGSSWTSLTITDNTSGLDSTGTVTWSSTVDTSKPRYLNGYYLYFYRFTLDTGNADIYYVTVDAPWQDITDIWDAVLRQPIQFQASRNDAYEDWTLEVNEASSVIGSFVADIGELDENDHTIIMFEDRMAAIKWQMVAAKVNAVAATSAVYYWNGSAWATVANLVDLTLDAAGSTKTLARTGVISWTPPEASEEFKQELFGVTGYAYRIVFSAGITDATSVDTITGVPAPLDVKPFKFPALYKNRVMLCGFTESNEGNRMDFSASNAPNMYNGFDSSDDGFQSLYFGGEEELSAATQLYNRFGSNIFATLLVLKDTETYLLTGDYPGDGPDTFRQFPISFNVGCPAPLTLATAELGYEVAEDAQRNVAFWLSYSGPMMFDGAVMMPLKGVENYFDDRESECINTDAIANARGWYDQSNKEYNLLIPSGTSQTTNNKWLVYNLQYKKWFEKYPATYPQAGFPVMDIYGTKYIYGTLDTGRLMRLENGTDWDGTDITHTIETGDFFPSGNPWDITLIRYLKLVAIKLSEANSVTITHYADTDDDGTSVGSFYLPANLVTNGTMELDANWSNFGTPTTNERSSTQAYGGTYSRKFIADSASDGIESSSFTTVTDNVYTLTAWVYPSVASISVCIYKGSGSGYNVLQTLSSLSLNAWNKIKITYTEAAGGSSASIAFLDVAGTGTYYVDDVVIQETTHRMDDRLARINISPNITAWSHRVKFDVSLGSTSKGFRPTLWGFQYRNIRKDK